MKTFAILADGTCDLSEAFQNQYDVRVLPGHIILSYIFQVLFSADH